MAKHIGKGRPEGSYRQPVAEGEHEAPEAEPVDVGGGARDPAGTSGANEPEVPVRPGGGGMVYDTEEEERAHAHERDVQARGSFEPTRRREGEEEG